MPRARSFLATIACTRLLLAAAALVFSQAGSAQTAPVVVENLVIPGSIYVFTIPRLEISESSLTKPELLALIAEPSPEPLSLRLTRLGFREATIPELIQQATIGGDTSRTVYRDVRVGRTSAGVITSIAAASAEIESRNIVSNKANGREKLTRLNGTIAGVAMEGLDLPTLVRVFAERSDDDKAPLQTLYAAYRAGAISVSADVPEGTVSLRIGSISSTNIKGRPGRAGLFDFLDVVKGNPDLSMLDEAGRKTVFGGFLQIFDNFDFGAVTASDIEMIISVDPDARRAGTSGEAVPVSFKVQSLRSNDGDVNLAIDGVSMGVPTEKVDVSLDSYLVKGFSFRPTIATLKRALDGGTTDDLLRTVDPRDLLPVFGSIVVSGLKVDGPNFKSAGVGRIETSFADPVRGIPTAITTAIRNLVIPVVGESDDPFVTTLRNAGIDRLDLTAMLAVKLDEPAKEVRIDEISLAENRLGSVKFTGLVGNVQKEIFSGSLSTAQILALALTARSLELRIENRGFVDLYVKAIAESEQESEAEVRTGIIDGAREAIEGAFGPDPLVERLVTAITAMMNGRSLTIKVRSRNDLGLGMMDFIAASQPREVIAKVVVDVSSD